MGVGVRELKQTSVYTFIQSSKVVFWYLMLYAQYLPSALSKVATRSLLCYERLLSTRVSNVARVSLERAPDGCASFSAQRCYREWVSFSAQFWTYEIRNVYFCSFLYFAAVEWIQVW